MSRSEPMVWSVPALTVCLLALAGGPVAAQILPTDPPTASAVQNGRYTISWSEVTGGPTQMSMELRERVNAGSWGAPVDVTGTNSRPFTKPVGDYGYQLRLTEYDPETQTTIRHAWSAEVTVVVPAATAPGAPGNLTATPAQSTGSFTLAWTAAAGAVDHYAVHRRVAPSATWPAQPDWTGTGLSLARNPADGDYSYRVQACNASNACGPYSNTVEVAVLRVPGVPGSLGPSVTTGTSYSLSWAAASGTVTRYELEERVGTGGWRRIQSSTSRSRLFRERDEDTYRYQVRACNALCGGYTATKTVTVLPPANLTGPTTSTGIFALAWTLPAGTPDIPKLEHRMSGAWHTAFQDPGDSSATLYQVCHNCEGVHQYRLRFCDPPEADAEVGEVCDDPGRVHRVTVDHPTDDARTAAGIPSWANLSQADRDAWDDAISRQGVNGRSRVGSIGTQPQAKLRIGFPFYISADTWFPIDGYKHTLCGEVADYDVYDPGFPSFAGDFAEADFNHMIVPNARHAYVRDDVDTDDRLDCQGQNDCVEAEATPDQALFNNPWFNLNGTTLQGRDMCVHGAWVGDAAHGRRPEIHPYELAWWRTSQTAASNDEYHLVTLRDDSQRFHRWGISPAAEFWIAFEYNPGGVVQVFRTSEPGPWVRYVESDQDGPTMRDADDGTCHTLLVEGQRVAQVEEQQSWDDNIGVRFEGLSREASGRVRGYVVVRTRVGRIAPDQAGFHVIRVDHPYGAGAGEQPCPASGGMSPQTAAAVEAAGDPPAERRVRARSLHRSLRRVVQDGRAALVMDVEVGAVSGDPAGSKPIIDSAAVRAGESRWPVAIAGKGPGGGDLLREIPVPIGHDTLLELRTDSGETLGGRLRGIGLAPGLASLEPVETTAGKGIWRSAVEAAGGRRDLPEPPADLLRVARWDLQLATLYGTVRNGRVALDEDSHVAEILNERLHGGGHEARALFGSERPLTITWSFVARDLTTGAPVPVAVGASDGASGVRVRMVEGKLPEERLSVWFPTQPEGHLYEVVATARIRDVFGIEGELHQRLWSFAISGDTPESLAAAVLVPLAAEAGLGTDTLRARSEASVAGDPGSPAEAPQRRARILRMQALHAAADGLITVAELADLRRAAARLQKR